MSPDTSQPTRMFAAIQGWVCNAQGWLHSARVAGLPRSHWRWLVCDGLVDVVGCGDCGGDRAGCGVHGGDEVEGGDCNRLVIQPSHALQVYPCCPENVRPSASLALQAPGRYN
eukprot:537180-Alexandrium_andersonii.AAC.1